MREEMLSAPEVLEPYVIYLEAWNDLTTTRSLGFGIGPIPWTACRAWCDDRGYDQSIRRDVWDVIRRLDVEMMEHWRVCAENDAKVRRPEDGRSRSPRA